MKIEALHVNMRIRHPKYGLGTVKRISEHAADIQFEDGLRTIAPETGGIEPAEPQASLSGLEIPLAQLIDQTVQAALHGLGLEKPDAVVEQLGPRWHKGRVVLHPVDATLQTKEIPLETFFHKIVMMRNNLRVLEQKINGHPQLSDGEKVEIQQYITRCYGSMTTFNLLFKNREDQFTSA
ncbi:MAG: hypothetical protein HY735_22125 [Verrucomicrobia bacterium]|nr:hypothetical protein [Verrucomicrobiota bacterium]